MTSATDKTLKHVYMLTLSKMTCTSVWGSKCDDLLKKSAGKFEENCGKQKDIVSW